MSPRKLVMIIDCGAIFRVIRKRWELPTRAGDETLQVATKEEYPVLFFVVSCEVFIAPADRFVMGLTNGAATAAVTTHDFLFIRDRRNRVHADKSGRLYGAAILYTRQHTDRLQIFVVLFRSRGEGGVANKWHAWEIFDGTRNTFMCPYIIMLVDR